MTSPVQTVGNKWMTDRHPTKQRTAPMSIIHPALTAGIIHLVNLTLPHEAGKEKAKTNFLLIIHSLKQMSIAWVWALRAIRVLKMVSQRWLPESYAELIGQTLTDSSNQAVPLQSASPGSSSLPVMQEYDQSSDDLLQQSFDASWLESDLFQSELSFLNVDQWPDFSSNI